MSHSNSSADLIKGGLKKGGELTDGTSPYHELAIRLLNHGYLAVLSGSNEYEVELTLPWSWALSSTPKTIILRPAFETGTVALTNASTSGTFSSAPAASLGSFANRWIKVTDRPTMYRIASHTAGATAFTIDTAYLEPSVTAATFKAIPIQYDLGEKILRLVEPFRVYGNYSATSSEVPEHPKIYGIGLNVFREKHPLDEIREGIPDRFTIARRGESATVAEFNRYPKNDTKVDFDWIEIPAGLTDSDQEIPPLPRADREVLEFIIAHGIRVEKGDGEAALYWWQRIGRKLKAMQKAEAKERSHTSRMKGRIMPRQEQVARRPVRRVLDES